MDIFDDTNESKNQEDQQIDNNETDADQNNTDTDSDNNEENKTFFCETQKWNCLARSGLLSIGMLITFIDLCFHRQV